MRVQSAAKVLIRRKTDNKYLILTSSLWPENPRRSKKPDLPGGLIEEGETIEEGMLREVKEEIGLDISIVSPQLGYCMTYKDAEASTNFFVYVAEIEGTEKITLSWEHESYDWLSSNQLRLIEIRPPYESIFSYLHSIGMLS